MIPFDLVLVRWHDASHPGGEWQRASEIKPEAGDVEMVTCGLLIRRTRWVLVVAVTASCESDPQISGEMTIPRGCVREFRVLVRKSK